MIGVVNTKNLLLQPVWEGKRRLKSTDLSLRGFMFTAC